MLKGKTHGSPTPKFVVHPAAEKVQSSTNNSGSSKLWSLITHIVACLISPAVAMIAANRGNPVSKSIARSSNRVETKKDVGEQLVVVQLPNWPECGRQCTKDLPCLFTSPHPPFLASFLFSSFVATSTTAKYSCLAFSAPPHPCLNTSASQSRF